MSSEVEMLDFEAFKERYEKVPVEEYPNNVREAVPDPVVSVHLLTYNHADYIREAIESVLMQEVDFPMEIVLGDDDSSDGTREICIEYAKQHPDLIRLQLHHRENNHKLDGTPTHLFQFYYNTFQLRGQYFAVLSGDDYWTDPQKLQKQADHLSQNPSCVFVHHPWIPEFKEDEGLSIDALIQRKRDSGDVRTSSQYLTRMYRSEAFTFYEECMGALCEDIFMGCVVRSRGTASFLSDIRPGVYRRHEQGMWTSEGAISQNRHQIRTCYLLLSIVDEEGVRSDVLDLLNRSMCTLLMEISACDDERLHHIIWWHVKEAFQTNETQPLLLNQRFLQCAASSLAQKIKQAWLMLARD